MYVLRFVLLGDNDYFDWKNISSTRHHLFLDTWAHVVLTFLYFTLIDGRKKHSIHCFQILNWMILRRAFSIFQSGFQFIPRIFYIIRMYVCEIWVRVKRVRVLEGNNHACWLFVSEYHLYPVGIVLNDIVLKACEWLLILCSTIFSLSLIWIIAYSILWIFFYFIYINISTLDHFTLENNRIHNRKPIIVVNSILNNRLFSWEID